MSPQGANGRLNEQRKRQLLKGVEARRPPERDLPLHERLKALAEEVSPADIDEIWVFPPLPNRDAAAEFLLLTRYHVESDRHRRVITAHVEAEFEDEEGLDFAWVQRIERVGPVPRDWLESLPDSLLGRFAEAGTPEVHEISGEPHAWEALVARLAEAAGVVAAENGNGNASGKGQAVDEKPMGSRSSLAGNGGASEVGAGNGDGSYSAEANGRSNGTSATGAVQGVTVPEGDG